MMKTKLKHFQIDAFDRSFTIVIAESMDQCLLEVSKEYLDFDLRTVAEQSRDARAFVHHLVSRLKSRPKDDAVVDVVMVLPKEYDGQAPRFVAHESVHAAYYIIDSLNIEIDVENHEILAKLVDFIFQKAIDFIDGKIK